MKKKILIVSSSLVMGGLERCLVNFCDALDYEKYEVALYLFNEGRDLLEKLNKNVKLLPDSPYYADVYNKSLGNSIKTLLQKKKLDLALYRLGRFFRIRFGDRKYSVNDWKNMQETMLKIDTKYDIAIGFEEETSLYYVAECVQADVKIGWIHTDIKKINSNKTLDEFAFEKLDSVITVSQNSLKSLQEEYPSFADKFKCITLPKLMNEKEIERLSQEPNRMDFDGIKILSVGRLVELKGFHLCVPACKMLVDDGYKFKWFVAGDGSYRKELEEEIKKYGVEDRFILLGNCCNSYTYIRSADICVQPSSYEGYSVAVFEEKYFKKAVVVSDIPSNLEMIVDGKNGIVVQRTAEDIYRGVKALLDDEILREKLANTAAEGTQGNEDIIAEIEKSFEK